MLSSRLSTLVIHCSLGLLNWVFTFDTSRVLLLLGALTLSCMWKKCPPWRRICCWSIRLTCWQQSRGKAGPVISQSRALTLHSSLHWRKRRRKVQVNNERSNATLKIHMYKIMISHTRSLDSSLAHTMWHGWCPHATWWRPASTNQAPQPKLPVGSGKLTKLLPTEYYPEVLLIDKWLLLLHSSNPGLCQTGKRLKFLIYQQK